MSEKKKVNLPEELGDVIVNIVKELSERDQNEYFELDEISGAKGKMKKLRPDLGIEKIENIYVILGTNDRDKFIDFLETGDVRLLEESANLVLKEMQQIEHFVDVALPGCKYRAIFRLNAMWVARKKRKDED